MLSLPISHTISSFTYRLQKSPKRSLVITLFLIIVLPIIIVLALQQSRLGSHAAEPNRSEAENGINQTAQVYIGQNDPLASNNKYIQFGGEPPQNSLPTSARNLLGTSLDQWIINDQTTQVVRQYGFKWFTPGNEMKMQFLGGCNGQYAFPDQGDKMVKYAKDNGLQVHGHTIIWHNQLSSCASSFTLDQFKQYVRDVATHYCTEPQKVYSMDIVNEALSDNGGYRTDSIWYKNFGAGYIEIAFQEARSACSSMKLYYNDYNTEGGQKFNDMMNLIVRPLAQKGLIDGVGFQAHVIAADGIGSLQSSINQVTNTNNQSTGAPLEVAISEMDVRFGKDYTQVTSQDLTQQANIYRSAATICYNNPKCVRFTVWGIDDGSSWVNSTDLGEGKHNDAPLLFDRNYQPKPAYQAVKEALHF